VRALGLKQDLQDQTPATALDALTGENTRSRE
jgi:hypothetical protein